MRNIHILCAQYRKNDKISKNFLKILQNFHWFLEILDVFFCYPVWIGMKNQINKPLLSAHGIWPPCR